MELGLLLIAIGAIVFSAVQMSRARRERSVLLEALAQMNYEVVLIYHCGEPHCHKCWGNAKAAHDIALNVFEERKLLQVL